MPLFQAPLVSQKRWALHEKYRKRGHTEIRHGVLAVRAPAPVRKRLKTRSQYAEQVLHWPHCHSESDSTAAVDPQRATESTCRTAAGSAVILRIAGLLGIQVFPLLAL